MNLLLSHIVQFLLGAHTQAHIYTLHVKLYMTYTDQCNNLSYTLYLYYSISRVSLFVDLGAFFEKLTFDSRIFSAPS